MAGLLTHALIALIGGMIFWFIFKNWKYGGAFAIGSFTPDLIDFGIAGIREGSLDLSVIMNNDLFQPLAILGHTFGNWIIFGLLVVGIILWLYNRDKISKKTFKKTFIILVAFLTGIAVHLILDTFIIESSPWI